MTGKGIGFGDFMEVESMRAIFGDEFVGLIDDGFERSGYEYGIFSEVFYRNKVGKEHFSMEPGLNSRESVGMGSRDAEPVKSINEMPFLRCENSTITSRSSVKNMSREDSCTVNGSFPENVVSISSRVQECSDSRVESDLGSLNAKRIKLSHGGNLNPGVVPGSFEPDSVHVGRMISSPVVEYSVQGIVSDYHPLKKVESFPRMLHSSEDSNINTASPDGGYAKEVVQDKIALSPVSNESSVPKLLVSTVPVDVEEKLGALSSVEETPETRWLESLLSISDPVNTVQKSSGVKDCPDRLRRHMKYLLVVAGWKIEIRPRKDRTYKDSVYIASGKKRTFCSCLPKAWRYCGERLLAGVSYSIQEDDSSQWVNVNGFWSDLLETLARIEKDVKQSGQTYDPTSLRDWWVLLDPFVTVALVEKLGRFKEGKAVKSVKGVLDYSIEKFNFSSGCNKSISVSKRCCNKKNGRNLGAEDKGSMDNKWGSLDENIGSTCQLENLSDRELISESGKKTQVEILNMQSLKSTGNDFCDSRDISSTECNLPKSRSKRITRSLTKANCTGRVLPLSSQLEGSFLKISFAEDLATSNRGSSSTEMLDFSCKNTSLPPNFISVGTASWDKPVPLGSNLESNGLIMQNEDVKETLQKRNLSSQPVGKLLIGDQPYGALAIEQKMPSHPPITKVLANGDMLDTEKVVPILPVLAYQEESNLFGGEMASEVGGPNGPSHKKSKKLSKIKVTKSCSQCTKDNLSTPQKVEENDIDCANFKRNQENIASSQLKKSQKCHASIRKNKNPRTVDTVDGSVVVADNGDSVGKSGCMGHSLETSSVCVNDESKTPQAGKKVKANNRRTHSENGRKGSKTYRCNIDDDDLLVSAIIKKKEIASPCIRLPQKAKKSLSKHAKKMKNQKGGCRLLPRGPGKGGKHSGVKHSTVGNSSSNMRTVLSWLIDAGVLSENAIVQYRSLKDNVPVKDGWVTRDGLVCKCCNNMLSISEFKLHAGSKVHRPCLNLFLESGESLTLCQLQAWSIEYKARKGVTRIVEVDEIDLNDDTCGLCGDGGDLICCDSCPSAFHQACLMTQELPEGNWYCANCICQICGNVASAEEASRSLIVLKCAQCDHKYHKSCMKEGVTNGGEVVSDAWFCGQNCQEVYLGLRSRVGVLNYIDDGFSWTLLRCIHGDQKVHSAQRLALMAECNTKLAVALTIMEECFLPMIDPRTGIDMIPHVLYNWGSNFARLNYEGFYTVVLEKGDNLISVASIRIHGIMVAEMPLIATCSENRRQGMCRRLMNAIEEMLTSYKVERLVISAIPALVDTWTLGFGYKPVESKERFNDVNLMVFPGTTLLEKCLYGAQSTECTQPDHQQSSSSSDCNQVKTIARPGSLSVGESLVNLNAEKNLITETASTEVPVDHTENRKGENMFQVNREENKGLPRKIDFVKRAETKDHNLSCILDRKDINSLMKDLNLGPQINNYGLSDGGAEQVLAREEDVSLEHSYRAYQNIEGVYLDSEAGFVHLAKDHFAEAAEEKNCSILPGAPSKPQGLPSSNTDVEAV